MLLLLSVVQFLAIVLVLADRLNRRFDPHRRNDPLLSKLRGAGNEADLLLLVLAKRILSFGFPEKKQQGVCQPDQNNKILKAGRRPVKKEL